MLEYIDQTHAGYQPGVCNIGPAEIRRRQQTGWIGLIGTVGLGALLLLLSAPAIAFMALALPMGVALSGFLQARLRFCAGFGVLGLQNFDALGEEQQVVDADARAADRRKALAIFGAAALGGLAVGMLATALALAL